MSIRVITTRFEDGSVAPNEYYEDGHAFYVNDGHLFVTDASNSSVLGVYAPGKWVSAHEEDASVVEPFRGWARS